MSDYTHIYCYRLASVCLRLILACTVFVGCSSGALHVERPTAIYVVDTGSEPRQLVNYTLSSSIPEQAELTLKIRTSAASTAAKSRHDVDYPTVRIIGRTQVSSILPSGEASVTFEIVDVVVLTDVSDQSTRMRVERAANDLKGIRESWRMDHFGRISEAVVSGVTHTQVAKKRLIEPDYAALWGSVVFPNVEIGIGAVWQMDSSFSIGDEKWKRTARYRLKALIGTFATVEAQVTIDALPQVLTIEPNMTRRLTSGHEYVSVESLIDLKHVTPTMDSNSNIEVNYSTVRGHLRTISSVNSDIKTSIKIVSDHNTEPTPIP